MKFDIEPYTDGTRKFEAWFPDNPEIPHFEGDFKDYTSGAKLAEAVLAWAEKHRGG